MPVARNGRGVAVAVVTVGLLQSIALPGIAQAGFFDFLFGQTYQPRTARPYGGDLGGMPGYSGAGSGFRRHADRGFHRHGHKSMARRTLLIAGNHTEGPVPPTGLMDDESLRYGDAVMTPAGIRIFIGGSSDHHAPADFKKLSEIKGLPKAERKALAALDAQGSGADGEPGMTTGRSANEHKLVIGETIIDPQGCLVRYVGP